MSFIGPSGTVLTSRVQYVNSTRHPTAFNGVSVNPAYASIMDTILGSSIFAPLTAQQAPMDTWGNVKIPVLSELKTTDGNGWAVVGSNPTYSSLVGIPVTNLSSTSNSSFVLQSAYFTFACPSLISTTLEQVNTTLQAANQTLITSSSSMLYTSLMLPKNGPKSITILSAHPNTTDSFAYTVCNFDQTFVESQVLCVGENCYVDKMRSSPATVLELPLSSLEYMNWITGFTVSGSTDAFGVFSPLQFFINDTTTAGSPQVFAGPDFLQTPTDVFNRNLAILLNTFWMSGISPSDMTGKVSEHQPLITQGDDPSLLSANASATSTALVYKTNWGWLGLLFASSALLLLGALIGAICDSRIARHHPNGMSSQQENKLRRPSQSETLTLTGSSPS
jgi:hypothetical protein